VTQASAQHQRVPGGGPAYERLPELVRLVRRVPDQVRRFAVPAAAAWSRHRVDGDLLTALVAAGLPVAGEGDDRLFDDYDLGNIALHLGLTTVRRMAIRSWSHALRRNSDRDRSRLRVSFAPRCPVPGHPGRCQFALLRPGGGRELMTGDGNGTDALAWLDADLRGDWPDVPPAIADLAGELSDVEFFLLPEAIRWDPEFMLQTRIADCGGAAGWLVEEGRRRGISTRFAFGLLVTKPYSTPHCWAEVRSERTWIPLDPLLIKAMRSWGSLDEGDWPSHRSIGPVVSRLCGEFTKLASHGGIWSQVSLPTDYLP
jgi:hypothetical protein